MTGTGIEPDDTGFVAVPTETLRPAAAGEGSDRTEAQGARETAGMVPRRRVQTPEPAAPPVAPVVTGKVSQTPSPGAVEYLLRNPGSAKAFDDVYHGGTVDLGNPYAQFLRDPADDGVALQERLRLNRQKSFYTESVAGSTRLLLLSNAYKEPDPPDIDPERKRVNQEMRDEYVKVVADLEAAEHLKPWSTSMEGLAALGGALEGIGLSPESWIGWGAKGASWMARTAKAGAQQSVIQGASDPLIQTMNIQAGVQDHPEWRRTVGAMLAGFGIGAGGHLIGEGLGQIIGQRMLRKQLVDLSHLDPAFQAPEHAAWAMDPANGIRFNAPERELSGIDREVQAARQRRAEYGKAPEHSFAEAVAMEKTAAQEADKAANAATRAAGGETKDKQPGERDYDARTAAFHKETGTDLAVAREHYGLDEDAVNDISKLYDRQPNEHPKEALTRAMGKWIDQQEAEAIKIFADHDSELMRDWDEANRIQERYNQWADAQPFSYEEGNLGNFGKGLGEQRTLPGITMRAGERIDHDVPFESGATHEGGRVPEGRQEVPGEGAGAPGRGEGAADGSRPGAERPAGGDAAGGAGRREGATEPGAEGKPQQLIPGVEPITDRQRLEAESAKPMRGGDAPPSGMFDQDARAQGDLLGREIPEDQQGLAKRRKGGKMEGEEGRPAEGIPHDAEKTLAIQSLQQQSMALAEALNFPLREGRVRSPKHAGEFNPRSGVVRVREVPDFDVVSHEAGHAIEQKIGAPITDLTKAHALELRKLDYDQGPRGKRVNEGFAEYVRLMMTNPEYAKKNAPGFDAAFRDLMAREEPDVLAKIEAAAQGYYDYHHASSVDAIESVVRSVHEEPGVIEKVKEAVSRDQLPLTINAVTQKVYDGIFDDKAPFTRMVRDLGRAVRERTGRPMDLLRAEDPEALWRLAEHSRQTATLDLQYGMRPYHEITPSGPALTDALAMALGEQSWWGKYNEGKRKDFSAYLVARQGEYLWRRHDAGEIPNPPVAFSAGDGLQAMKDLEALYPNFKDASDMVHIYTQEMLRKARDGHLITTDLFDKLMAREFYVPFMRDMTDKPVIGSGMGQGAEGPGTTQIVKALRGSSRDIIDPLESIMSMTFLLERTLAHNDVALAMARLGEKAGSEGGKWVEQLPAHQAVAKTADLEQAIHNRAKEIGMPTEEADILIASLGGLEGDAIQGRYFEMERAAAAGEPILFYREGGELKAMRVISEKEGLPIYELMTQAPPLVTDLWANIISGAAALKRSSIITNPTFVLTNYIRDQMAAMLLRPDYVPFYGGIKGMADEWRQGNNAILYSYAGGVAGGRAVGVVDKAVERDINMLAHKGYAIDRIPTIKEMLELASFTEAGTRNSIFGTVFEASKAKGLSDYEALIEAAFQARDILDFSRHGSRTMWLRRFLPFFNAHLQGLDKAKRTAIDPIINRLRDGGAVFERDTAEFSNALMTITKTGAAGGALGAIYAAVMSSNDAYKDATPYLKGTHLIVPWGNKQFVIPKPFEMGLGFTAGEYAYHAMAEKDPRAARMFAEAAWDVTMPPNPISDFPLVTPAIELTLGKSLFTGRDIVPEQLQKLPSGQQVTDRTSSLSKAVGTSAPAKALGGMFKWLGDETGISPIKIDYAIGSQFATWGRDVMAMSQGVDQNAPAASLDDMVFFRRFVKDPTRSSDINMQFWKFMSQTTGKFNQDANGYRDLVKEATVRGQPLTQASEFLSKLPAAEKAFVTLKEGANDAGKPAFNADERRLHPLQHAYDAVEMLTGLRKELSTNTTTTFGERGKVTLDPEQRRLLLENVRELSQMEMRNALVIMGTPGYQGRMVLDPNDVMDKIKHISPVVASEIADRYAAGKVFSTDAIVKAWPQLRDDLVRNGTNAQIRLLAYDARAQGYQFNGQRVKRPGVVRAPIAGERPGTTP